jgi:lipopolysaccharide transport system ATP-binding protein
VLFVSHDMGAVKSICTETIFLHVGTVRAMGDPSEVASLYHAHIAEIEAKGKGYVLSGAPGSPESHPVFHASATLDNRAGAFRHGTAEAKIRNVELLDENHCPTTTVEFNQEVTLRVHVEFLGDVEYCILGYILRDRNGVDIVGTNTREENVKLPTRRAGDTLVVDFKQRLPLAPGNYSITTALASDRTGASYFDWIDNALVFEVQPPRDKLIHTRVWLPVKITVHTS